MAIQQGIMPFSGKMGEQVGVRRNGKLFIKKATRSYEVTQESKKSGKEFGRGSSASALVRQAFEPLILLRFKADLHNRLSERFREVIRSGPVLNKGNRRVTDGDISFLRGFEFSSYARFHKLVSFSPEVSISATSVSVTIPAMTWKEGLNAPPNATRAVLGLAVGFFDFESGTSQKLLCGDLVLEKQTPFEGANVVIPVPKNDQVVMVMMNLFFGDIVGQQISRIDNRLYQAGIILDAAHIRKGKLVQFIPEELPEKQVRSAIQPDISWQPIKSG